MILMDEVVDRERFEDGSEDAENGAVTRMFQRQLREVTHLTSNINFLFLVVISFFLARASV